MTVEPDSSPTLSDANAALARKIDNLGYFFAASSAILFSSKGIIIKLAYGLDVGAETFLALRMGLSMPFYLVIGILAVRDRKRRGAALPTRKQFLGALVIGLIGYWFASYTDFLGLEFISAQFERLILFTYPLFVVLLGAAFFNQPIAKRAMIAFAVSYAGLALVFSENVSALGDHAVIGTGLVLAAAAAFALYQLLARDMIGEMGPRLFTCIAMSGASLGAFTQFFLTHPPADLLVSAPLFGYAILIAIGATVLPSFFLSAALHRISAQANATIGIVSPIATIVLAALILHERMNLAGLLGSALVLAGIGWFTLSERKA